MQFASCEYTNFCRDHDVCFATRNLSQPSKTTLAINKPTDTHNKHMSSDDTQADMPPSSIAKAIKFGPFTVTSQVRLSPSLTPPLPHQRTTPHTGLLQNPPILLPRKPQAATPRPHPSMPFALRTPHLRPAAARTPRPVLCRPTGQRHVEKSVWGISVQHSDSRWRGGGAKCKACALPFDTEEAKGYGAEGWWGCDL